MKALVLLDHIFDRVEGVNTISNTIDWQANEMVVKLEERTVELDRQVLAMEEDLESLETEIQTLEFKVSMLYKLIEQAMAIGKKQENAALINLIEDFEKLLENSS